MRLLKKSPLLDGLPLPTEVLHFASLTGTNTPANLGTRRVASALIPEGDLSAVADAAAPG